MSLQTWKEEFYPIEASKIKIDVEAVRHSLQKEICALCQLYTINPLLNSYVKCPLYRFLLKECDNNERSPYNYWLDTGNPISMITAL